MWQSIEAKFCHWQKLELSKVVHNPNHTDNANGDVPLTAESAISLISSEIKLRTYFFGKKIKTSM